MSTLRERAKRIAEAANECCVRCDGYQEAIEALALKELEEAITGSWGYPYCKGHPHKPYALSLHSPEDL